MENREFGQETDGYLPESEITKKIEAMVKRSRNHPSIILWSLCNEAGCLQRSPEQAVRKGNAAKAAIHALDHTRPMTAAINFGSKGSDCEWDCLTPTLEIVGMNYNWDDWDAFHANNTNQPMVSSEMTRSNSVRSVYAPTLPRTDPITDKGYSTVFQAAPGYVNTWHQINSRREWLAGGFLWTGMDYLGEPNSQYSISSSFGAVDIAGFSKDSAYFFKANWTAGPRVHIVEDWRARAEGTEVVVWVFSNNEVDTVQLHLNGAAVGEAQPVTDNYLVKVNVSFAAGELKATGYAKDGKTVVASDSHQTATAAVGMNLTVDFNADDLRADGADVFMARVAVVDKSGRLVPDAGSQYNITFSVSQTNSVDAVSQPPAIFGVANGDPSPWVMVDGAPVYQKDKASWRAPFAGLARVIVQSGTLPGAVVLTATAKGLGSATVSVLSH